MGAQVYLRITALVSVIDDDESVRESLPELLREFGLDAQAFASADEFLKSDSVSSYWPHGPPFRSRTSLAHELSQPISGTMTNASARLLTLGRDEPDLDEVQATVTRIVRDAQRAGNCRSWS